MTTTQAVVLSLLVAMALTASSRPARTAVSGLFSRDKKGRLTLVLSPARKRKRKRKR